jgi:hypothetical protein
MRSSRSFRLWITVCVLALAPQIALAQQARKAGVVTALKGQVAVARAPLPGPAPLNFKDDVFYQDRVTTERDSSVRLLLGGKALVTVRELSDFRIQEEPNKATITLGLGRMALEVIKRLMAPGEEIEVRTPNAIAAIRGSFILWDVTPDRTVVISLTPSTHTAGGITYHVAPNEMWTFPRGQLPTHRTLTPAEVQSIVAEYVGGIPPLYGDRVLDSLFSQISAGQTQTALDTLQSLTWGDSGLVGPPAPPPPPADPSTLCVNCRATMDGAASLNSRPSGGTQPQTTPPINSRISRTD